MKLQGKVKSPNKKDFKNSFCFVNRTKTRHRRRPRRFFLQCVVERRDVSARPVDVETRRDADADAVAPLEEV